MNDQKLSSLKNRLETVIALARLLERVERSGVGQVGADQYRSLVRQLQGALAADLPADALKAVFGAYPATAEIYENMHYDTAGLAQSPLDRSVATEMLATQLLHRISRKPEPLQG